MRGVVKTLSGKRVRSRVNLKGLPRGRYTVRVEVTTTLGERIVTTRRYAFARSLVMARAWRLPARPR